MDPVDVEDQASEASRGRIRTIPALNNTHDRPRDERVQRSAPLHATIPTSRNTNTKHKCRKPKTDRHKGGGKEVSVSRRGTSAFTHHTLTATLSHEHVSCQAQSVGLSIHGSNSHPVCACARRATRAGPERTGTSRARPGSRWRALVGHITSLCCGGTEAPFAIPWRLQNGAETRSERGVPRLLQITS